eukprot:TRINITY_DN12584_c1_g1_i1.p1 TRINITY_DN12584_c1_g1~~TRINITY_DN12584_c1_g1_i1.p1  ORF type:complete len:968 (+),score=307.01 TRINITY_DN12584_c1_g1_i1:1665-4568(+)
MAKSKARRGRKSGSKSKLSENLPSHEFAAHDVFDQDGDESHIPTDFDLESYEYKLPDNFEDEEIDSDDAFNSEDEAKYGHLFDNRPSKTKKAKKQTAKAKAIRGLDLLNEDDDIDQSDEDEDDMDDDDDEGGMMLSELLGSKSNPVVQSTTSKTSTAEAEEDDDEMDSDIDDDVHDQLLGAMSQLDKKRVRAKERTEARAADESALNSKRKVQLSELMGSLTESGANLGAVKKQLEQMSKAELSLGKPLDRGVRDEIQRDVVYAEAAREVSKWMPIVTANRKADHLTFGEDTGPKHSSSTALTVKFKAETQLEKEVATVLGSSATVEKADKGLTDAEQLALRSVDPQEAKQRRQQLAKLRALESYYEAKCRRAKKIKSKKYRKIQKKAREAQEGKLSLEELAQEGDEAAQDRLMKAERDRAKERMTLRHKNQGKWAKRMLQRGRLDKDSRRAIGDQLAQEQELRRKIQMNSDDDKDDKVDGYDSGSDVDEDQMDTAVAELERDILSGPSNEGGVSDAVASLKFMQQAVERKRQEAQHELEQLKAELTGEPLENDGNALQSYDPEDTKTNKRQTRSSKRGKAVDSDDDEDDDFDDLDAMQALNRLSKKSTTSNSTRVSGAVSVQLASRGRSDKSDKSDKTDGNTKTSFDEDTSLDLQLSRAEAADEQAEFDNVSMVKRTDQKTEETDEGLRSLSDNTDNPWLTDVKTASGLTPAMAMDAFTRKADKRMAKLQRKGKRKQDDASTQVDVTKADEPATVVDTAAIEDDDNADTNGKEQQPAQRMDLKKGSKDQQALIQEAFAGDNILQEDFEAEKDRLTEQSKPKDKDLTLPGWGVWGGEGVKDPFPKRKVIEKAPPGKKRKDNHLKSVIISEKVDKKLASRQVQRLPHGFRKSDHFERTLAAPVGREWNTDSNFRQHIRPRVETKAGKIIQPMKKTQGVAKEAKRRADAVAKKRSTKQIAKKKKLIGMS